MNPKEELDTFDIPTPPRSKTGPLVYGEGIEEILARGLAPTSIEATHLWWFRIASSIAMLAQCQKAHCGAVLVSPVAFTHAGQDALFAGSLLAYGFNGPPQNDPAYRKCGSILPSKIHPKADRTCCVHAEARALFAASRDRLAGATLYFARVDAKGSLDPSGRPYCTGCSKLALDLGVRKWVLWHAGGPREYFADEYNHLSHEYDEEERRARERGEGHFHG